MVAAANLVVDVDANTEGAAAKLSAFGGSLGKTAMAMAGLGAGIAAGAGVAAFAIGKIGIAYDDALNTFQSVSGATEAQMKAVSDTAKVLGNDLTLPGASAADAAVAMAELAKGGLSVDEAMKAAKGTMQLAAAAGTDVQTAATIASDALNTFSLEGDQAGRVADTLAAGANASSADIGQMAQALTQVGASAAAAHLSIEDTTAIIGLLANNGIKGSDAGTSLKTMLSSLVAPAGAGAKQMEALGLSMYDSNGKMVPFREMLTRTATAIGGLGTEEEKAAAIQKIFGSDASRAAQILLKEGVPGFDAMRDAVSQQGAAQEVAAAKSKGLGGALRGLQSNLETLAITIYDSVKGPLEGFVRGLTTALSEAVTGIGNFITEVKARWAEFTQTATFATIVAALQSFQSIVGQVFSAVSGFITGTLMPALDGILGPIGGLNAVLPVLAAMLGGTLLGILGAVAAAIGGALLGAVVAVAGIFLTVPGIIAGVVAALVLLYQRSETFRDIVAGVWEVVQATVQAVVSWFLSTAVPAIQGFFSAVVTQAQNLLGFFQRIWPAVVDTVRIAWDVIKPLVQGAISIIRTVIEVGLTAIKGVFTVVWTAISGVVEAAINIIKGIIKVALGLITGDWKLAWDGIKNVLSGVWGLITTVVKTGLAAIDAVLDTAWAAIKGAVKIAWDAVVAVLKAAWVLAKEAVKSGVAGVMSLMGETPGKIKQALGSLDDLLLQAGRDVMKGLLNGIRDAAGAVLEEVGNIAGNIGKAVAGALKIGSPSKVMRDLGYWTGEGLRVGIASTASSVAAEARNLANAAVPTIPSPRDGYGALSASGAMALGGSPRGGTVINVAAGAVQVNAQGANQEAVGAITSSTESAFDALLREIQSGRRV